MIKIIYIKNSFEPSKDREITYTEWEGKTLDELLPPLTSPIVYLNQKRVEDFSIIVPDDSEIVVHQKQEATAIAGWVATSLFSAASLAAASTAVVIASYAIAGAVIIAGSRLLSSVLNSQSPNAGQNSSGSGIASSQTYSWTQSVTRPNAGSPLPIIYGTMQTAGSIIQRRIEYVGDYEYLYLQLALCMGEIEDISSSDILINDNPITDYTNVEYLYTNGTTSQGVMNYFGDVESANDFSVEFSDTNAITKQISGNAAQALRIFIQFPQGIYYQNDAGGLDGRTVSFKVEYKLLSDNSWTTLNSSWGIYGATTSPINRELRVDNLNAGQYEVRITRLTAISTSTREMTTANWTGIGAIVYDDLYYPNVALLGLRIKATGQLSGTVTVLTTVTRKQIEVFDENSVSQGLKNLDNPAWVFWDALTNTDYGYGLNYNQVDYTTVSEWAIWCDELVDNGLSGTEKRAVFNGTFDYEGNLWDALSSIATVGRASPIIKGTKYSVIVDKSAPMVQLFNMGNIIQDSLKISYIGDEDLATEVEVQFVNKDKGYSNDTLSVVVPEWYTSTNQAKKSTIHQMGITNASQAYRVGRYFLNNNKYVRRTAEFKVALDAIDCEAGDVIGISHDVPMWGQSGRIVSATSNTVTLDKAVTLKIGNSYTFTARLNDNTFETLSITFGNTQETNVLSFSSSFTTIPSEYDIYSLVESPHTIKLFRINSITRENDDIRKVVATEYNDSIVSDDTTIIPTQSASEATFYPTVISFTATERGEVNAQGVLVPFITLSWDIDFPAECNLYISKDGEQSFTKIASDIKTTYFEYNALELEANKGYFFKIVFKSLGSTSYHPLDTARSTYHTFIGNSSATTITIKDKLDKLLYENGLLQKAIQDGLVTIYSGTTMPTSPNFYDLWKINIADLTVDDFLFDSVEIKNITANSTDIIYKYYNESDNWELCNQSQIAFINSTLAQLSTESLADGKARVFTTTPTAPYDIGDIWIQDGGDILTSSVNQTVAYNATDFGIKPKYTDDTTANAANNNTNNIINGTNQLNLGQHINSAGWTDDTTANAAQNTADTAISWAGSANSLIVNPTTGLITGWGYADNNYAPSNFSIHTDNFFISNSTTSAKPFSIVGNNIHFNGKVDFSNVNNTSNLALTDMSNVTTIDGGKITAGSSIDSPIINSSTINSGTINGVTVNSSTISGNTINGGTINGVNITGSVIKSSWIDYTTTGDLTNWQYFTSATVGGYASNFAHDNSGNLIVDSQGYVRLAGKSSLYSSGISLSIYQNLATETAFSGNDNVHSYDSYTTSSENRVVKLQPILNTTKQMLINIPRPNFSITTYVKFNVGTDVVKFYVAGSSITVSVNGQTVVNSRTDSTLSSEHGFSAFGIGFTAYVGDKKSSNIGSLFINNQVNVLLNKFDTQKTYLFGNIKIYNPSSGKPQITIPSLHYT